MKILVPVKRVVDYNVKIRVKADGSGVQVGQEWGVYAVGEELVDPDTGETLGAEEVRSIVVRRCVMTISCREREYSRASSAKRMTSSTRWSISCSG